MTDQFEMFSRTILNNTNAATSSRGLDYGTTRLTSRDGKKVIGFGQALAPASRILQQVDKKVRQTIDTYGQNGCASSKSVDLQQSLESKLQTRFPSGGLTMFIKGWKRKATPSGRLYCQLAVSARPIDESAYGLWATPNTMDSLPMRSFEAMKRMAQSGGRKGRTFPGNLREQVQPEMCEAYIEAMRENGKDTTGMSSRAYSLWPTPNASDNRDRGDWNDPCIQRRLNKGNIEEDVSKAIFGTGNGSTAQTGSKGSLNPAFPCWLMGIPNEWVLSIARGMQSSRKSPQGLSNAQGEE